MDKLGDIGFWKGALGVIEVDDKFIDLACLVAKAIVDKEIPQMVVDSLTRKARLYPSTKKE